MIGLEIVKTKKSILFPVINNWGMWKWEVSSINFKNEFKDKVWEVSERKRKPRLLCTPSRLKIMMLNKFPVAVVGFRKKHLEHSKKHQATYKSQSCYWGRGNDKQSLGDQMFLDAVFWLRCSHTIWIDRWIFFFLVYFFLASATLTDRYIEIYLPKTSDKRPRNF